MHTSARIDASSSLHATCDSRLGRAPSEITSEQACQLAELAQRPPAQQAQLQQSHRRSQGGTEQLVQDSALAPCLQLRDWSSQQHHHQQQQQHGQLLSQPYPHSRQQQLRSSSAGMGVSTAGHPLQLLQAFSAAAELPNPSISPAVMPRQQLVQLSQQKEELPPQAECYMSAVEEPFKKQQQQHQQQQCEPWQHESAAQHNPFLHAVQQQPHAQQPQGTPSAATTASNVSAFASAAGEGGSVGNRSSSSGGSSSGVGAGAATVSGRTVTGPACGAATGAEQHHVQQQQEEQFILRHTRQITCKTYLKRLNVTQYMSDNLLPTMEGSLRVSSQKSQAAIGHLHGNSKAHQHRHSSINRSRSAAAASDDEYDPHGRSSAAGAATAGDHKHTGGSGGGSGQRSYEMMFKVQIKLVDSAGQVWPVTYEGVMCAGQRHLRLTCGWSEFIKAKKIGIGDSITFEQRGGNKTVLAVAIQKAGQEVEEMWLEPLPQDEQIKVLVGSLRSDSAAARGAESGAAAKGSAGRGGSSRVAAASPNAAAGPAVGGRGRQPGQHQQVAPGVGSAGRQQQLKRGGVQAKRTKKRRQRDESNDEDDRDLSRSYDEASSGSTAVTDGTAGTNSGSRINSAAAATTTFAPTVQGLQALRVDSAPGRLGQSGSLAAAAAAAIAAVAAGIVDGPAEGSDGSVPRSSPEGPWQQQQQPPGVLLHKQLSPAMAAPAGGCGQSRYALESPGYAPQAQLQQQQFQRRLRQRQQYDDECSCLKLEPSGTGADHAAGQAAGANKYTEMAAAAIAGNRRSAEWAAVNRLGATDSVQSHQLLQQQSQQQVQEEHHRQYQQQLYSSGSAPLGPGPASSQPMGLAHGTSPNPGSFRSVGWQVSTGYVGDPSPLSGNGGSGDVYTSLQQLYQNLQPMPSIGTAVGGSAVEGTAPVPVLSQQPSALSQQRLSLSRQGLILSQQQSIGGRGSLAPQDLAAYGSGVYQPNPGTHYSTHRKGPSPTALAPGQTPAAHRSSITDARSAPVTASAVARTLMVGPSRPQMQQAGLHLYPSAAQLPRGYSLQQQQMLQSMDSSGSWPISGSGWQQQQQPARPSYLVKTEQVLHPESPWDPQMLQAPLPAAAKQQQSLSPYEQVQQLPQQVRPQDHKQQQHQQLEGVSSYKQMQQQEVSPYEQVQHQQHWHEGAEDDPTTASAGVVAHTPPQRQLQHEQSQDQLLESAGMSAEFGSLDSIGAMESVELVDTLLQLLGNEQADQQQQVAAAGAAMAPLQQQRQSQETTVAVPEAGPLLNHALQPQSLYQQQTLQPQLQAPQLDHAPGSSSLLQQWRHQPSHKSQLAPPTLLPLEAVIQPRLQHGAG